MSGQGTDTDTGCLLPGHILAEPGIEADTEQNYRQYLHRLFGDSTAEYFLSPSSRSKDTPPRYRQMMEHMGDHVSAEALWDALRERSIGLLREMEVESSQVEKLSIDWDGSRRRGYLLHLSGVRVMFHSAQHNQAYSALLLSRNPSPLLSDSRGHGPCRYLPQDNAETKGNLHCVTEASLQPQESNIDQVPVQDLNT